MPPIETIAHPHRNRISVVVPREYGRCAFRVILVPLPQRSPIAAHEANRNDGDRGSFIDALLSCPKLDDGEVLDVTRDVTDFGRDIIL